MTTQGQRPLKKLSLQEQLAEEQKARDELTAPKPPAEPTAQERTEKADAEITAFKREMELESIKSGYTDLKTRETTIANRELNLEEREEKLKKDIGAFELEQKERVAKTNDVAAEYNKQFSLLTTERAEAKRIMEEAITKKAEAENIIKSQTEAEKNRQEKSEAHRTNMGDALALFTDIIRTLRKQDDAKILTVAGLLGKDYKLIQRLQYRKSEQQTIADIIAVECDRIHELCEYLQDSKHDYGKIMKYLLDCTEWFYNSLKIEWMVEEEEEIPLA